MNVKYKEKKKIIDGHLINYAWCVKTSPLGLKFGIWSMDPLATVAKDAAILFFVNPKRHMTSQLPNGNVYHMPRPTPVQAL